MRMAGEISTVLRVHSDDATDTVVPRSEILIDGRPTGQLVDGAVLEAAVAVDRGFLVFVTEGVPEEELLSIYLVDREGRLVERANIGQMYTSGRFAELVIEGPDTLRFRFLGNGHWWLRLLPSPEMRVPFVPEAPCVSRPFGFRRRFRLRTDSTWATG